jgi:predicted NBD/HSP70 family sugar kinase
VRPYYLGVDIGGTNTRVVAMATGSGGAPRIHSVLTPSSYLELVHTIVVLGQEACDQMPGPCLGVGVGVAGQAREGIATFVPALPFLDGMPLAQDLRTRFDAPVWLANDAQCALLAEQQWGAARGRDDVLLVVVGTGVGGAFVMNGRLVRGVNGVAGSVGWLPSGDRGPDLRLGGWERDVSGSEFAAAAAGFGLTPEQVWSGASRGASDCLCLVDRYAYKFGRGVAALASVVDPELIVIGGVLVGHSALLEPAVSRAFEDWASPAARDIGRVMARLGARAGVLGAWCLALGVLGREVGDGGGVDVRRNSGRSGDV